MAKVALLLKEKQRLPLPAPRAAAPNDPVFHRAPTLKIVCWNTLKLRLDAPTLREQWTEAIALLAEHDVIVLQEVPGSRTLFRTRVELELLTRLHAAAPKAAWQLVHSRPSPPQQEVHVLIVRKPLRVVAQTTIATLGSQPLEHAPLVCTIEVPQFRGAVRFLNIVSVHLPPSSSRRRSARNAQFQALVGRYPHSAEHNLGRPVRLQAVREAQQQSARTLHVFCGDFNASATEMRALGLGAETWKTIVTAPTSSGGKQYDNFVVQREVLEAHFTYGYDVYNLTSPANFKTRVTGVSDHAPIALRLTEQAPPTRASSAPNAAPVGARPSALHGQPATL